MPTGFFPTGPTKMALPVLPQCGRCGLYKKARTPKMKVAGKGRAGILVVGEAPGKDDDRGGEPFTGASGRRLRQALATAGIDAFRDCWLTNALICHPAGAGKRQMVNWCRPNVVKVVEEHRPKVILLLGSRAVQSVIGWLWKEDAGGVSRWAGFRCPSQQLNAWVCPTYNPAWVLRMDHEVADRMFDDHVRRAVTKKARPWKAVPDWEKGVETELNPDAAASKIATYFGESEVIAFDYETTCLKPDAPGSQVYCCAISDGRRTLAYPWHGRAATVTLELLASDVKKVGQNIKFEDRWTRDLLGVQVENWLHDGMQVAHVLDNRDAITGLKFQAFARLGMKDYDSHVKPYLQSDEGGGYGVNRIKELPLVKVLEYCGMDALLEFKVWQHQTKELNRYA